MWAIELLRAMWAMRHGHSALGGYGVLWGTEVEPCRTLVGSGIASFYEECWWLWWASIIGMGTMTQNTFFVMLGGPCDIIDNAAILLNWYHGVWGHISSKPSKCKSMSCPLHMLWLKSFKGVSRSQPFRLYILQYGELSGLPHRIATQHATFLYLRDVSRCRCQHWAFCG